MARIVRCLRRCVQDGTAVLQASGYAVVEEASVGASLLAIKAEEEHLRDVGPQQVGSYRGVEKSLRII